MDSDRSLILILLLIACSAFFSVAEIALASSRRLRLRQLANDGDLRAEAVLWQDLNAAGAPAAQRDAACARLVDAERTVRSLPEEYRALIQERQTLREMLAQAHERHADTAAAGGSQAG